jgi:hypothetical protein
MDAQEQRRLLELAAKAAGYRYAPHGGYIVVDGIPGNWNPITDDGNALRLAIDLELDVSLGKNGAVVEYGKLQIEELNANDPYAAVRLAIVRAAAAIGEKMGAKP